MLIDYRLSSSWNRVEPESHLEDVDERTLRYDVALGDAVFQDSGADFSANWGWVPLIDFAACMVSIVDELSLTASGESIFEFTESNSTIRFEKIGAQVRITCSYAPGQILVPFASFDQATRTSNERLRKELVTRYPSLDENETFQRLLPRSKPK